METVYDYKRLIADSKLPPRFKHDFQALMEEKISHTLSTTTGALYPVSAETQARRVATLLAGFRVLRSAGFALTTPWNFKEKHLRFLLEHWVTTGTSRHEIDDRLTHWRKFVRWTGKVQLLSLIRVATTSAENRLFGGKADSPSRQKERPHATLAYSFSNSVSAEAAMTALIMTRGSPFKAARLLGVSVRAVAAALAADRKEDESNLT
ncbi:hypothetical protein [Paraburkholderia sp.]|uniref:hypothetical protein n=1 Tax=Paraburkholderia sp. TaxID=1926495 RepID=UPI003D7019FB